MKEKLTKKDILQALVDDSMGKEESLAFFEKVVKVVEDLRKENGGFVTKLDETYQNATKALGDGNTKKFSTLKAELLKQLSDLSESLEQKKGEIDERLDSIRDGKDADPTVVKEMVLAEIKLPEQKELIVPREEIRDKLESLEDENRLDASAIKGLDDLVKKHKGEVKIIHGPLGMQLYVDGVKKGWIKTVNFKAGTNIAIAHSKVNGLDTLTFTSSGGAGSVTVETPPEAPNQVTTVFTVTAEPKFVVADGTTYFDGAGYTYAALQVTMSVAPSASIRVIV